MKVTVKDAPNSQKELLVKLPYEVFVKASEAETTKVAAEMKIPGFRAGKAPREMVYKQNEHKIRSAALEEMINVAMRDAFIENKISPISQPNVHGVTLEDNEPIEFTIMVDVFPEFDVTKFEGFKFDRTNIKVDSEDVESTIKMMLEQKAEFQPIPRKRMVRDGDQVTIDFEGKLDNIPFEGGTAQGHKLIIGSNQFIPGFEEQVIGMKIDEEKDLEVTFPEDYQKEDLAGQAVIFTVKLHAIEAKIEPEFTDEFVKEIHPKAQNTAEFKVQITEDLQYEADQFVKFETFTSMLNKIVEENNFEIPTSIINDQAYRMAQQNMQQYYEMGLNPETFGITPESMMGQFVEEAEIQVKRAITLNKLADGNGIIVEEADITKELERISNSTGRSVEELRNEISNSQHYAAFQNEILADKVYTFLSAKNEFNDKTMSRTEFEAAKKAEQEAEQEAAQKEAEKEAKKAKVAVKKTEKKSSDKEDKAEKKTPKKDESK